jgi:transcriptional regulator with XRE-family HTH domain
MAKKVETRFKGQYGRHYIREWRKFRRMTLEALASRVGEKIGGFTHASLSRIERGLQPYSQPILEAIADALRTDPASPPVQGLSRIKIIVHRMHISY